MIIAGFGRTGAVVGRFLRANGVRPTILDHDSEKVEVLRKVGIKVFYGDASRLDLLHAAGADKARLLILAIDSVEKTHLIAEAARKHFPNLRILATVATRHDAYEILDTGVTDVYREALDSALRLGVDALSALGFRAHQAVRSAHRFRHHEVEGLRSSTSCATTRSST